MTEDEARTKWCPFARDSNTGGNRLRYGSGGEAADPQYGAEAASEFPCIGSSCMAWNWTEKPVPFQPAEQLVKKDGRKFTTYWTAPVREVIGDGCCGLTGPQK